MSNRGEGWIGIVLGAAAVGAILALFLWLGDQTEQVEADRAAAAAAAVEAERDFNAVDLLEDPTGSIGRNVVIEGIRIMNGLGQAAFSIALNETEEYPVLLSVTPIERLRAEGISTLYGGDSVYLAGRVYSFNDSIAQVWVDTEAVRPDAGEMIPESVSFLLADSIVVH